MVFFYIYYLYIHAKTDILTIKDIARLAGVSPGTVDRILHKRGGVSKDAETKVLEIIEKAGGFTPNVIARNLVLNKVYQIAVLMPLCNAESPFWQYPKEGILKAIEEVSSYGMKVSISYFDEFDVETYKQALDEILKDKSLDGMVIAPHFTRETLDRKLQLEALNIPYVFMNVPLTGLNNISFVGQDSFGSGRLAAKLFHISQNTRKPRILVVEVLEDFENYYGLDQRVKGFMSFFEDYPSHFQIDKLRVPNKNSQIFHQVLEESLKAHDDIGGMFFPSNALTKAGKYFDRHHIKLDMIVGYDVTEENKEYINKGIFTFLIGQEPFQQGYKSIKLMFEHLISGKELNRVYHSPVQILAKENLEYYMD